MEKQKIVILPITTTGELIQKLNAALEEWGLEITAQPQEDQITYEIKPLK
jgi:hypothetical protein